MSSWAANANVGVETFENVWERDASDAGHPRPKPAFPLCTRRHHSNAVIELEQIERQDPYIGSGLAVVDAEPIGDDGRVAIADRREKSLEIEPELEIRAVVDRSDEILDPPVELGLGEDTERAMDFAEASGEVPQVPRPTFRAIRNSGKGSSDDLGESGHRAQAAEILIPLDEPGIAEPGGEGRFERIEGRALAAGESFGRGHVVPGAGG